VKVSVRSEVEDASGIIRLGCHTAVSQYTLPEFLGDLLKKHPGIELQLTHGLSRHMTEMVISNQLDVAIAVNPVRHLDLIIKEICRDEVTLWYSKSIKNKDVLLIEPSLLQTQDVLKKLKRNGIQFQRVIESSSLEVIANFVANGVGYGILPERVLNSIGATDCEKVKQAPHFTDKICLVYKNEFRQLKRGEIFIQMLCR
jgi:DNA-binding transcriptional LysR family regulator